MIKIGKWSSDAELDIEVTFAMVAAHSKNVSDDWLDSIKPKIKIMQILMS